MESDSPVLKHEKLSEKNIPPLKLSDPHPPKIDTSCSFYVGMVCKFKNREDDKKSSPIVLPDIGIVCYSQKEDHVVEMLSTVMMMNHLGRNIDQEAEQFTDFIFEPPEEIQTKEEFAKWVPPSKGPILVWNPLQNKEFYVLSYGPCCVTQGGKDCIGSRELEYIYSIHSATHSLGDFIEEKTAADLQLEASYIDPTMIYTGPQY